MTEYEKERFSFLNTSKRIMDNGTTTATQPLNPKVKMEVKLFGTIKERMNSDHHRKIQQQLREIKYDFQRPAGKKPHKNV